MFMPPEVLPVLLLVRLFLGTGLAAHGFQVEGYDGEGERILIPPELKSQGYRSWDPGEA